MLINDLGVGVIIVTHDEESALEFADMIVSISPDGDSLKEVKQNG